MSLKMMTETYLADDSFESEEKLQMLFDERHLKYLNKTLAKLPPKKILEWAMVTLPDLYQITSFGLTGLVILDMISKISHEYAEENEKEPHHLVPLIFFDTLYHFPETLSLSDYAASHYKAELKIFKPFQCDTVSDFERLYGTKLWETDESTYDYLVKVEPSRRAYRELGIKAIITGRRRSQKGERENIDILEIEEKTGLLKLNPLAHWDFTKVITYVRANEVPYNKLIDQGYRSIGDWHSTRPAKDSSSERDGRWEGKNKTECGLHKDYFKMRAAFIESQKKRSKLEKSQSL
ncbi:12410_t:CDS:2 [Acaulospora morrowiae]|uniref:12410_t:CDS:1 n=1 Tax=Acaulospora morrowiae TaxID=94023 RepID=A0A9N9EYV4_9GLOM|nr:12410_t:CDS:2 [Acaulospora morrowiae]